MIQELQSIKEQLFDAPSEVKEAFNEVVGYFDTEYFGKGKGPLVTSHGDHTVNFYYVAYVNKEYGYTIIRTQFTSSSKDQSEFDKEKKSDLAWFVPSDYKLLEYKSWKLGRGQIGPRTNVEKLYKNKVPSDARKFVNDLVNKYPDAKYKYIH